jgi:amino acid adenylation domain-containing protein
MLLHDLFRHQASRRPDHPAVVGHGLRLGYGALQAESRRLADGLIEQGVRPGERVAVWMANSAEAAVAVWAVLEAGAVLVPLHAAARRDALQPVVRDADLRFAIVGSDLSSGISALLEAMRPQATVLVVGPGGRAVAPGTQPWSIAAPPLVHAASEAASADPGAAPAAFDAAGDPGLAAVIYTSGSTGEPKGVMLSHANMIAALRAVNAYLGLDGRDVIYSALPLSSSYGLYQLVLGLAVGATVVLDRSFAFPTRSMGLMAAERCTVAAAVPTMFAWLATTPSLDPYDLSALRIMTSAAAALPVEHARRVGERLPRMRLFVMYGQTECKRISYLDPADLARKPGSVGRGMPYQDHGLLDESGRLLRGAGTGELVVRGPHVMQGYWRKPEASAAKLREIPGEWGRWLHTGDVFRVDEDGYLFFVGRRDDILKVGGHKVSPREVEEVLCQIPAVREAAVTGVEDPVWGEAVRAHLVLREGASLSAEEVVQFCSSRLRGFMVPKVVRFVRDLPKTESGKVKKRELA